MRTHAATKRAPTNEGPTPAARPHATQPVAVRNILRQPRLQPRLKIGAANDRYEQEADRVADRVMRMAMSASRPAAEVGGEELQRKEVPGATPALSGASEGAIRGLSGGGAPLPASERTFFEPRFGQDFSGVRIHNGPAADTSARSINARAFTLGSDIAFASGEYTPGTPSGRRLLAHELTHVGQQGGESHIRRGLWGDIWGGLKSVGTAIAGAVSTAADFVVDRARDVGRFVGSAVEWVGGRLRDAGLWALNLIRDLPARLMRLGTTLFEGLVGVITFLPEAIRALATGGIKGFADWLWDKAKAGGLWVLRLVSRVFDVLGGPELVEFIWHMLTKTRGLTSAEIEAASSVLGPTAIRWGDVRVAEGGLLDLIFAINNGRAFVAFHTVNLPPGEDIDVVVHELTHVYQFERAGSVYLGQAIHAQITEGASAYDYGGPAGLVADQGSGKHFSDFNREQQAQIAQDYYKNVILNERVLSAEERVAYDFFVGELRAGDL